MKEKIWLLALVMFTWHPLGGQTLQVSSFPVGAGPLGVAVVNGYAVVANSGDNSLTLLKVSLDEVSKFGVVTGIPSPYAVVPCGGKALVTSPSDNSVRVVLLIEGNVIPVGSVLATAKVGSQPKTAACYSDQANHQRAVVSNYADNTLSVIDVISGSLIATIPDVPGARGFRGVHAEKDSRNAPYAWVAGTDANVITIVDLTAFRVLNQIPFRGPTAMRGNVIASEADGTLSSINLFSPSGGTIQISNLRRPQDFVGTEIGTFVTQGGVNELARFAAGQVSAIGGIPTPAAVDTFGFNTGAIVTSTSSNSVYLIKQVFPPRQFGMANGASFAAPSSSPGMLASVFVQTTASQNLSAMALPLPTSLGGLTLSLNGTLQQSSAGTWTYSSTGASLAPLLFVGPTQVNFQVPPGIAPGDSVAAQLTKADGSTLLTTVRVTTTAPGIFTLFQNGQGQAAALNQDNTRNGDPAASVGARPATRGSVIQIFATGAGATNPAVAAGVAAPSNPLALTVVQPTVTIGGKTAAVQFSGLAPGFVGLWQINAVIPSDVTPGSAVPLSISAGGVTSNTVTIAVQ